MIYVNYSNISSCYGLSKNLDTAIQYLENSDMRNLEMGRNDVSGDNVYINRFDYMTTTPENTFFEAHEQYIDIHVVLSGDEYITVADTNNLKEIDRDDSADFVGFAGDFEAKFQMNSQKILIVFPTEAHMVKLQISDSSMVEKAVFKVKV